MGIEKTAVIEVIIAIGLGLVIVMLGAIIYETIINRDNDNNKRDSKKRIENTDNKNTITIEIRNREI